MLFVGVSVVLAVVLLVLVQPIVRVMSTPAEAVEGTVRYLTICFIGIPFITAYNVIASIFRGLGDSKSPMYFIAVACVANIALDYLFIGALHMGPAGAALGTTLSQTISVAVSLLVILKKKDGNLGKKSGFSTRTGDDGAGAQNRCSDRGTGWIYPGGIYHHHDHCQPQGTECSRCSRNRGKNHQFSVPGAIFNAFHGVCVGSTEHGSRQIRTCRSDSPICDGNRGWFRTHCVIADLAGPVVGLFTTDATVILLGAQYIRGYIWDCIFAGVHFSFSGYFCAYGKSEISFVHNLIAILCVRIPGVYLTSKIFPDTLFPMGLATATGSLLSVIICMIAFGWLKRKEKQKRKSA